MQLSDVTMVIPAAGAGSRLNPNIPKPLYPICGKPMISHMVDLFKPYVAKFTFVLSPQHHEEIRREIDHRFPNLNYKSVIQQTPKGMADALAMLQTEISTTYCGVSWVDQVLLTPKSVEQCFHTLKLRPEASLILPTIVKSNPYIEFKRSKEGKLQEVLQAREGEITSSSAEGDCGLFLFNTSALFEVLVSAQSSELSYGNNTKEFNLLPLLPRFEQIYKGIVTIRLDNPEEGHGVNTFEDAKTAENILRMRQVHA